MPMISYSTHVRTVPDDRVIFPDLDCELAVAVTGSAFSEPEIRVTAVYVTDAGKTFDLLECDDILAVGVGLRVKKAAEADTAVFEAALQAEGFVYHGHPGDPSSGWRRPRGRAGE